MLSIFNSTDSSITEKPIKNLIIASLSTTSIYSLLLEAHSLFKYH